MNKTPRKKESIIPNCKPLGSARNSAQQPYLFATILCPISCKINAGPTANSITGIASSKAISHSLIPPSLEIPDKPLTAINPNASVNAAVARRKCCFSISLNSHTCLGCELLLVSLVNIFFKSSIVYIEFFELLSVE